MASVPLSTPYTPIFPPPLPKKPVRKTSRYSDDDSSSSCHLPDPSHDDVPYIQRLRERYLKLASIPYELCAPSRENSPGREKRIDSIRARMRERQECRLPFELALTCVGVAGGDWVGEPLSDIDEDNYILPRSEAEWFQWERRRKAIREKRKAERQAEQRRNDIAKWTEGIQADNVSVQDIPPCSPYRRLSQPESIPVPLCEPSPPPAPMLEPLHDFNDSISGNSAPSLPFSISAFVDIPMALITSQPVPSLPLPLPLPPLPPPRPTLTEQPRDTASPRDNHLYGTNPQLSSPISPPRSLKPLTGTQGSFPVSSKRFRNDEDVDASSINSQDILGTPRPKKRFKTGEEPITPKSVERPSLSQQAQQLDGVGETSRLPTLTELIINSKKGSRRSVSGQKSIRNSQTPRQGALELPEVSSSSIPFSMFIPQAESTQVVGLFLAPDQEDKVP